MLLCWLDISQYIRCSAHYNTIPYATICIPRTSQILCHFFVCNFEITLLLPSLPDGRESHLHHTSVGHAFPANPQKTLSSVGVWSNHQLIQVHWPLMPNGRDSWWRSLLEGSLVHSFRSGYYVKEILSRTSILLHRQQGHHHNMILGESSQRLAGAAATMQNENLSAQPKLSSLSLGRHHSPWLKSPRSYGINQRRELS